MLPSVGVLAFCDVVVPALALRVVRGLVVADVTVPVHRPAVPGHQRAHVRSDIEQRCLRY